MNFPPGTFNDDKQGLSFRTEHSEVKNLGNIQKNILEILPPFGRLNDKRKKSITLNINV